MISKYEALKDLKPGRYTIVGESEFGLGCWSRQVTVVAIELKRYAQYDDAVQIRFKKKGGRSLLGMNIYGCKSVLVYEGWVEVNIDPYGETKVSQGGECVSRESRYASFDPRFIQDSKKSVKQEPVFEYTGDLEEL